MSEQSIFYLYYFRLIIAIGSCRWLTSIPQLARRWNWVFTQWDVLTCVYCCSATLIWYTTNALGTQDLHYIFIPVDTPYFSKWWFGCLTLRLGGAVKLLRNLFFNLPCSLRFCHWRFKLYIIFEWRNRLANLSKALCIFNWLLVSRRLRLFNLGLGQHDWVSLELNCGWRLAAT